MSLSVAIVGLPNVGKSTLFNALLKKQMAYVANFPFATIEPNIGVVPVPDDRLKSLSQIYSAPIVNATVEFKDIAGLIEGASKGEGLGNKFLSHIRETDAICYVLRAFSDPDVIKQGVVSPKEDFEVLKLELELADAQTLENHEKKKNQDKENLPLFSKKPFLVVLNVDEGDVASSKQYVERYAKELGINEDQIIVICAKAEADLVELSDEEQKEYLKSIGSEQSALDNLIQKAFKTLGLITFLTAGEKEVRAWTLPTGSNALNASGVIHTDFMKKFIKADVVNFDDFISNGGWLACRQAGKVRSEGKDYIIQDGDIVEFRIGN